MKQGLEVILRDGGLFIITEEQINYWESIYTDLDVRAELGLLKIEWENEVIPRRTAKNISKYINKYLYKQSKEDL